MGKETLIGSLVVIALVMGAFYLESRKVFPSEPVSNARDAAVRAFVEDFGARLKNVSLLADDAGASIEREYGPFVSADLVAEWQTKPENAPGRLTSSPWPERIEVSEVEMLGDGVYRVRGSIVHITSDGPASVQNVTLRVEESGFVYRITEFTKEVPTDLSERTSVVGYWACLPHRDRTGPQTMECALGIALDRSDGYMGVNTTLMSTYPVDFPTGTKVRIEGVLIPRGQVNSSFWEKYDIDGVINATSITEL